MPTPAELAGRFRLWATWSERAWSWWDDESPARFEWLLDTRAQLGGAA